MLTSCLCPTVSGLASSLRRCDWSEWSCTSDRSLSRVRSPRNPFTLRALVQRRMRAAPHAALKL